MSLRRFLAGSLAVLFLMAPSAVSAQSVADLLAQIAALQAQIAAMQGGSSSGSCVVLTRNLYFGLSDAQTGGEVTKLQRFLGGQVTGYFGPATEQLVQQWQKKYGIVSSGTPDTTGYGAVGPNTRAAMARGCGTTTGDDAPFASSTDAFLSATPSSGEAPLTVRFRGTGSALTGSAFISFGDGSTTGEGEISVRHTYRNAGTYTATLHKDGAKGEIVAKTQVAVYDEVDDEDASCTIKSSKKEVAPGEIFTLKWTSEGIVAPVMVQNVKGGGEVSIPARGSMTWIAESASDGRPFYDEFLIRDGAASSYFPLCTVPVRVVPDDYEPTATFRASPTSISSGERSTLYWTSKNANRCMIRFSDGTELGGLPTSGSQVVVPSQTTTYYLSCTNDPGTGKDGPTVFKQVTVTVGEEDYYDTAGKRGAKVVGVYEGSYATPRGFQQHPEGTVNVNVTGENGQQRDLVLTSYEPVNWVLNVPSGVKITKIIVTGYYASRVTNVPSGTEVEYHSYVTDGQYYYAYESSGDAYTRLRNWIDGLYSNSGNTNAEYQFPGYSASSINVYVGYKG